MKRTYKLHEFILANPFVLFVILLSAFGLIIRFFWVFDFNFDKFIDRDIYRSVFSNVLLWKDGAELNGGGKTPGSALHLLLLIMYWVGFKSLFGIYFLYLAMHFLAIFLFARTLNIYFDKLTAALAVFLIFTGYFYSEQFLTLWNPTLPFLFQMLVFCLLISTICEKKVSNLIPVSLLIGVAMQIHISNAFLIPIVIISLMVNKIRVPIKIGLICIGLSLFLYIPFIFEEIMNPSFFRSVRIDTPLAFSEYVIRYLTIIGNFCNVIFFHTREGLQWIERPPALYSIPSAIVTLISSVPTIGLLYFFKISKSWQSATDVAKTCLIIVLILVIPCLLLSYPNQFIAYRRYLWAAPFIITASAIGLRNLISSLISRSSIYLAPICIVLICYCLLQISYFTNHQHNLVSPEAFGFKSELVEVAVNQFHFSPYNVRTRIGIIAKDNYLNTSQNWTIKTYQSDEGSGVESFLAKYDDLQNIQFSKQCLIVIRGRPLLQSGEAISSVEQLKSFLNSAKINNFTTIEKLIVGSYGVYFSYLSSTGNCISFFKSYYFVPEKIEIGEILKSNGINNFFKPIDIGQRNFWLFSKIVETDYFLFYLKMENGISSVSGRLYVSTTEVFSFNGIGYFYEPVKFLLNSKLSFTSLTSNEVYTYQMFDIKKADLNFTTLPLFFTIDAPPIGKYKVEVLINTGENKFFGKTLSAEYSIN